MAQLTADQFKSDVKAKLDTLTAAAPGRKAAINWAGALGTIDNVVQQFAPVLNSLLPSQYDAFVTLAATLIHDLATGLNPAPAPPTS